MKENLKSIALIILIVIAIAMVINSRRAVDVSVQMENRK